MSFTVLIAPSGFKESLGADAVAEAIAAGVRRVMPDAEILMAPLVDGGEGFVDALVDLTGGTRHEVTVTGPLGTVIPSFLGFLGGAPQPTAVIEMAAAAGLRHVPRDRRDPTLTTSYGVGELIRAALDMGAERILLGCGDSGVSDGGAGMAQALGARLLDCDGFPVGSGGGELHRITDVDLSRLDPRLEHVQIDAAVNWQNVLLGPRGVARVFGPQKGATPDQVELLERGLCNLADRIEETTGIDVRSAPGMGASGGLGAGLAGLIGARLHPRYDVVMRYLDIDGLIDEADLVVTAEGCLDGQSPHGKIPTEVARRAKRRGLPVIALAGALGKGVADNFGHGIDAFACIVDRPRTLEDSIANTEKLLRHAAEDVMRMIAIGRKLGTGSLQAPPRPMTASQHMTTIGLRT
jgi:glycerate kinase